MTKLRGEVDGVSWSYDLAPGERAAMCGGELRAGLVICHPDRQPRFIHLPSMVEEPIRISAGHIKVDPLMVHRYCGTVGKG